ncbi:MAG: prepilin-type N-terminal cleavage/methylation domain-containing protein [bacterium]
MKKINKKSGAGFTIIELIVVIAIIAVLAAIVLVNVTSYIAKSRDAAIKGNMSTIATNAAVYFDNVEPSTTYVGFIATSSYTVPAGAITEAGGTLGTPLESATAWCLSTTLNDTTTWCVDSTGYKGTKGALGCALTVLSCQ